MSESTTPNAIPMWLIEAEHPRRGLIRNFRMDEASARKTAQSFHRDNYKSGVKYTNVRVVPGKWVPDTPESPPGGIGRV